MCRSEHLGGDRWGRAKGTAAKTIGNNRVTSKETAWKRYYEKKKRVKYKAASHVEM